MSCEAPINPLNSNSEDGVFHYAIFGGCLRSQLWFPELRAENGTLEATWTLQVASTEPSSIDAELLGTGLEPHCRVRLYRDHQGFRLSHSCTGEYSISLNGRLIRWHPRQAASVEVARADVFGRVLAVAMHAMGNLTLHASAAALGQDAVAFLAPKGSGKSTLALALCAAGGRFITDDMLSVNPDMPVVSPGVQSVRLCDDSADHLRLDHPARTGIDGKQVVDRLADEWITHDQASLSAIYLLQPTAFAAGSCPVRRTLLSPSVAAMALVQHAKVGALLGKSEAAVVFDRATRLALLVPVYTLEVAHDFHRISEVVSEIRGWHEAPATAAA